MRVLGANGFDGCEIPQEASRGLHHLVKKVELKRSANYEMALAA
jgi:hypothetical protein